MKAINKVQLMGNIGKDIEIRKAGDVSVVSFPLATTEVYKSKDGERKENTEWHNIVIWGTLAEVFESQCSKGDTVYLDGKLKTRSREIDGHKIYITEISAESFILISKK